MDPVAWTRVWTDGSCLVNPGGPGGWGVVVLRPDGTRQEWSGGDPETTNNRMEMQAPLEALLRLPSGSHVEITSDSQYVVKGMTEWMPGWRASQWKRGTLKNIDMWEQLLAAVDRHEQVRWQWVRGHGSDPLNNRADRLATEAACGQPTTPRKQPALGAALKPEVSRFSMGSLF